MKHIKPFNESILSREEIANICNSLAYNHNYISSYGIPRGSWTINSDGLVDVYDNVNLYNLRLTKLPVRFGRIEYTSNGNTQKGSFYCNGNSLTTLDGAPSYVEDGFYCNGNNLTTLEGGPKYVGGNFECNDNKLTSFVGSPEIVGGDFYCGDNNITSFEGFPRSVRKFYCRNTPIYEVWRLFAGYMNTTKIELFNEFDIIRGKDIVIDRLNDFLITIGVDPVESVRGYNNI